MSLGIAFKGPEGIVLAADSRVTLTAHAQAPNGATLLLPATFDNATKLLKVSNQDYIGVVTYGAGAIGQTQPRTAHSFIPEFEAQLAEQVGERLGVLDFTTKFSAFFMEQWNANMPPDLAGPGMVFLVGGYDPEAPYGRVFEINIPHRPQPHEHNGGPGEFGITWGGQREYTDRLIQGFDPSLIDIVRGTLNLTDAQVTNLEQQLRGELSVGIPYQFLPLQDCVDLSIFLLRTTITIQNWIVGLRGVGGAIDVATITRTEGFRPIQQKRITAEN